MGYQIDPNAGQIPLGWHLFEIKTCEDKVSKGGDGAFVPNMVCVDTGRYHREWWMMQGNGAGRTIPKLKALGLEPTTQVIEAVDLVGRRFYGKIEMGKPNPKSSYPPSPQITKVCPESAPPPDYTANPVIPFDGKGDDAVTVDGDMPW